MKKLVSLLLIVTMVLSLFTIVPISVGAAQASDVSVQADNGLYVKVGDDLYEVNKGEVINYRYYLKVKNSLLISSLDINMAYDTEGLDFVPFTDENGELEYLKHFPGFNGLCVYNFDIDGKIYFNYSNITGTPFTAKTVVFSGQFKVTADKGVYSIDSKLVTLADSDMNKIVFDGKDVQTDIYTASTVLYGKTPVDKDDSEDINPNPTKTIYFLNNVNWDYVNLYYWSTDIDYNLYWPGEQMQFVDNNGEYDIYSVTIPYNVESIIFNGYDSEKDLYKQSFELKDFENDDCYYVVDDSHINFIEVEKDNINNIIHIKPKHTYTVAGSLLSEAGIFGTTWDPKNIANNMTYDYEKGLWKKTYKNVPATGDQWYEYVIAEDYSFDKSYGSTTGKNPQNGKIKVTENNSTVTIYFNGSTCWSSVIAPPNEETKTIYFLNTKDLVSVRAYYWDYDYNNVCEAWPGEEMPVFDDGGKYDIYCISVPEYVDGIIFNGIDPRTNMEAQTNDLMFPQDGDCYYMVGEAAVNRYDSEKDNIINVIKNNIDDKISTYTAVGESSIFGSTWDVTDAKNDLTYNENTKLWSITYENVDAIKKGGYEYKIVEDHSWDKAFTDKGVDEGGAMNALIEVAVDDSTVIIYFDGEKCWAEVVSPEIPTEVTEPQTEAKTEATEAETDAGEKQVYVAVDGKKYEVSKGEVFTYKYMMSVDSALKISSLDINVFYDKEGLEFVPYTDMHGDVVGENHFPEIYGGCVYNFKIDGEIYFNYSNINGVRFAGNAVVFTGQFKVTADEGTYNIDSNIVTLADTKLNKIVYCGEVVQPDVFSVETEIAGKTTVDTDQTEKPDDSQETDGLYIKVGDNYYEAKTGEEYEFVYTLNTATDNKISSVDARIQYDTEGLDFVPTYDHEGELYLYEMFPILKTAIFNHTIDGMLYFNYANASGLSFNVNGRILFRGKFKVTATEGVYEINPYIHCLEDEKENIIVNEGEVLGLYKDDAYINYDGPCVKVGNKYYEAIKGEEYEFVYHLQVEDNAVSSIDARIQYDSAGLDFIPTVDSYGDVDTYKMFPIIKTPVFNHTIDGMLYFNYVNVKGVDFSKEDSVLFRGKFKVTASSGVYEINPYIFCLEDTKTNIIVDEGVKRGEYKDSAVLIANYELGDANRDGKINIFDMTVIQRYVAEFIEMDKKQLEISDINQDGIVNIFDATAISRYIAYGS